jgi:hypothetical protein
MNKLRIIKYIGYTGYRNQLTNCIGIYYSTNYVYIESTCIPAYSIGPSVKISLHS